MNTTSACGELLPGEITREELLYCAAFDDEMFTGIITGAQLHALLEAVYEPERFGNNAAIRLLRLPTPQWTIPAPAGRRFSLSRGRTVRPLRRTSASASRSAPIWPPGGNDTGAIAGQIDWKPDRPPTITKPSAPMQSPSACSRSQTTRACTRPANRKTTTRPIERTEKP